MGRPGGLTGMGRRGKPTPSGLGPGPLCPLEAGTCQLGAPEALWPCLPALLGSAGYPLSFPLLPAGLPVLDANDPEGESDSTTRLTPKF